MVGLWRWQSLGLGRSMTLFLPFSNLALCRLAVAKHGGFVEVAKFESR